MFVRKYIYVYVCDYRFAEGTQVIFFPDSKCTALYIAKKTFISGSLNGNLSSNGAMWNGDYW